MRTLNTTRTRQVHPDTAFLWQGYHIQISIYLLTSEWCMSALESSHHSQMSAEQMRTERNTIKFQNNKIKQFYKKFFSTTNFLLVLDKETISSNCQLFNKPCQKEGKTPVDYQDAHWPWKIPCTFHLVSNTHGSVD